MFKENSIFEINYKEVNQWLINAGTNLLIAILILVIGFWLANILSKLVKKAMLKSKVDAGLVTFIGSFISLASKILIVITAITQLGIQMTSFITVLGAAGLAIGMAFSGTLSNFAGGIMILVLKPFKVGDTINAQGQQGTVKEIQIFNTYLYAPDNKVIILPNGPVANGSIVNITRENNRRLDILLPVNYGNDIKKVFELIEKSYEESDDFQLKDVCQCFWDYGFSFAADDFGVKSSSHQVVLDLGIMIQEFKLDPISFKFKVKEDKVKFLDNLARKLEVNI
jgi:small conductance mechanosensitive channel